MLRKIVLHGSLEEYGKEFNLDISTPAEAVRALCCQIKGLKDAIRKGEFRVIRGERDENNELKNAIDENDLPMTMGKFDELHIVPVAVGSKNNGVLKVILGVVLIGVGFAVAGTSAGALFGIKAATFKMLGAGMLFNGIGQMLSPTVTTDSNESAADKPSFSFNSGANLTTEGNIVPVAYGKKVWCSSVVLSEGMDVQEVL
jgi:predicted phage tail protein